MKKAVVDTPRRRRLFNGHRIPDLNETQHLRKRRLRLPFFPPPAALGVSGLQSGGMAAFEGIHGRSFPRGKPSCQGATANAEAAVPFAGTYTGPTQAAQSETTCGAPGGQGPLPLASHATPRQVRGRPSLPD